jgi:hypothetical protein
MPMTWTMPKMPPKKKAAKQPLEGFADLIRKHDRDLREGDREFDVEQGMWVEDVDFD